mgnify:CR=1 FL=1
MNYPNNEEVVGKVNRPRQMPHWAQVVFWAIVLVILALTVGIWKNQQKGIEKAEEPAQLVLVGAQTTFKMPVFSPEMNLVVEIGKKLNERRAGHGLPPFWSDSRLIYTAKAKSELLAATCILEHYPTSATLLETLHAAGLNTERAAENLAAGYNTADELLDGWESSPSHYKNLYNNDILFGIGIAKCADGRLLVTLHTAIEK